MGKRLPFLFGFRKNDCGEHVVEFLPNIHKIFGHNILNYLLISLVRSVLVKYRTSVFLHEPRLARSVLKNAGPYMINKW